MLLNKQLFFIIFSVLLGLVSSPIFGQKVCDCYVSDLHDKIIRLNIRDSIEVFKLTKSLEKYETIGCKFQKLNLEFKCRLIQKQNEKALLILKEQEDMLNEESCEDLYLFDIFYNKALYFKAINDFEKLSDFVFKSLKEAERLKDINKEILAIQEIVFLFTRMKENEKRWYYVKRAELLIRKQENITFIKNNIWLAYELENEYTKTERRSLIDSAVTLVKYANINAKKRNMYNELALAYRAMEAFSYHKGELDNALIYIDSAIFYAKNIKGPKNMSGFYLSKSWDHFDLKQYEKATISIDSALYFDDKTDIAGHMMLLSQAAEIYEGSGASNKALTSLKLHSELKDSLMTKQRSLIVNELETKYQTEIKDAKIKRLTISLILASLGIVSLLFIGTLIRLKQSRKQNEALKVALKKQLQLQKELTDIRDEIAQDFHDDLGNKLARISLLSNLVSGEVKIEDAKVKSKIKQIMEDANGLYTGTRDFIFSLKSNSDFLEEIITYLSDFGEDFFEKTSVRFVVKKDISINDRLPHYWNKQLIFIFKEALTNALKHSKCDLVMLSFFYRNSELTIVCNDNGNGMSNKEMASSNGLTNMKNRAIKIGGLLKIDSEIGKGTTITFIGNINNQ